MINHSFFYGERALTFAVEIPDSSVGLFAAAAVSSASSSNRPAPLGSIERSEGSKRIKGSPSDSQQW